MSWHLVGNATKGRLSSTPMPHLLGWRRPVEAPDDVLVPGGHDREHGGEPVPGRVHRQVVVEQLEAPGRGDVVVDAALTESVKEASTTRRPHVSSPVVDEGQRGCTLLFLY
jgi:hypothetical protein